MTTRTRLPNCRCAETFNFEGAVMDEIATTFFALAADVAQDRAGLGAPAELVIAVESATGFELTDAVAVAKLIVRAMHAQRAIDLKLMEMFES